PAVLLVTHDVDEAILLADRVLVLEGGRLAADLPVDLPGDEIGRRRRTTELRALLHRLLGVEDSSPDDHEADGPGLALGGQNG
ncbi:MAG TPA: hypothetical protein VN029_12025, partial [Sphingomonas sp.]|nr:hypothetical protein [Sphingomonas sp.]